MSNTTQPLVSVIMPVYNAERFLSQAIESVLQQTYRNIELIIVDDCSSDNSFQLISEYAVLDPRVVSIKAEQNQGVAQVRNKGIQLAHGEYIALLDSDDVWESTKLEKQLCLLINNHADIAYCSFDFIDESGSTVKRPFVVPVLTSYEDMLVRCVFTSSTILAKAAILKNHPFRTDFYHEDFLLWTELMTLPIKAVGDQTILMHNRQVSSSRSHNKVKAAVHRWKLYRQALGLSFFKAIIVFIKYAYWGIVKYYL